MKNVGILVSAVAIAAGVILGRLDHEAAIASRASSPSSEAASAGGASAPAPALGPSRGGASPAPAPGEAGGPGARSAPGESSGAEADPDSMIADRLAAIARLIGEQDFDAAVGEAEALTRIATGALRQEAARLGAKARAFEAVLAALPAPSPPAAAPAASTPSAAAPSTTASTPPSAPAAETVEVRLASGSTFRGQLLEEDASRYVIRMDGGGTYAPRKEDVLSVQTVAHAEQKTAEKSSVGATVAALEKPVDLFRDGVARYYRLGLKKEGLDLLEKVLAMPGSEQVPLLFVPHADAELVRDWQVAAGREAPTLPASALAEGLPPAQDSDPGERHRPAAQPEPAGGAFSRPSPDDAGPASPASIARAAILIGQGQALYQTGARQEGREEDLVKARKALEKAQEILETLPQDDEEIRKLERQVSQLLSDVARASPF